MLTCRSTSKHDVPDRFYCPPRTSDFLYARARQVLRARIVLYEQFIF